MTFGSDPEFFVTKNGKPISAIGVIKGNIENRISISGHEFYYDNVLAECAIKPGYNKSEVLNNFRECLQIYLKMVEPYSLETRASYEFPNSELANEEARRVGCSPDMCAYTMSQVAPPTNAIANGNLRSSGGHIHVGADILLSNGHEPILCVYMWDLLLGVTSLYLDKDPTSKVRRTLYGQPGRYRVKPYGMEYRTLSSFWLKSPRLVSLIYDLTHLGLEIVESGKGEEHWNFDIEKFFENNNLSDAWSCLTYDAEKLRKGINESDKDLTREHYKLARSLMPKSILDQLDACISTDWKDIKDEWCIP